jgi:hypothetical protein
MITEQITERPNMYVRIFVRLRVINFYKILEIGECICIHFRAPSAHHVPLYCYCLSFTNCLSFTDQDTRWTYQSRLLEELSLTTTLQGVYFIYYIFCHYMFRHL